MEPNTQNLTIGELLPADLQSEYSEKVLQTPLSDAINIAKYDQPSSTGLDEDEIEEIHSIYEEYENRSASSEGSSGSGSSNAYWDKSDDENEAYWDKNK